MSKFNIQLSATLNEVKLRGKMEYDFGVPFDKLKWIVDKDEEYGTIFVIEKRYEHVGCEEFRKKYNLMDFIDIRLI